MADNVTLSTRLLRYVGLPALGAGFVGAAALGFAADAGAVTGTEFLRSGTVGTTVAEQPVLDTPEVPVPSVAEPDGPPGWQGKKQMAPSYPRGTGGVESSIRSPVWRWFHDPDRIFNQ